MKKIKVLITTLTIYSTLLTVTCNAQNITTIAGNGIKGYSGDGGSAIAAEINTAVGVAVDTASGNIYFTDQNNNFVRKITASTGIVTTIAGVGTPTLNTGYSGDGGSGTLAKIYAPAGIAVSAAGNIYFADEGNRRVRKIIASTGIITTIAGNGTTSYSGDGVAATSTGIDAGDVALDAAGNVYITDATNNVVRKVTASTGKISTVAGNGTMGFSGDGGAAISAKLSIPTGVILDAIGNIYIADANNQRIRKVTTSTSIITTIAGTGTQGYSGDGGAATSAKLGNPRDLAIDASGNIYIADESNNCVRKITKSSGKISTIAGDGTSGFMGDGGQAIAAELASPNGVAVDVAGNVYIADYFNYRIRKTYTCTAYTTNNMQTICSGSSYTFNGHIYTTAATYKDTLYTTLGCDSIIVTQLTLNTLPSVTVNSSTTCAGTTTTLTASGATSYSWSTAQTGSLITPSPTVTTNYTVTGTDANNCKNTTTTTITVNGLPTITATSNTTSLCSGATVTLTASGATTYTWTNTNETTAAISATPTINVTYTVVGTDGNGCMGMDTLSIAVNNCSTGINEVVGNNQITVYPNPNNGMFAITRVENAKTILVTDVLGNELLSVNPNGTTTNINLSAQPNGIYFVKVIADNMNTVKRIIINK